MRIPAALDWWRSVPGGAAWLDRLPGIVAACAERWSLEVGAPLEGGYVALVLSATAADGVPVVLKVSFPEVESENESDALAFWSGRGAAALLEHDDADRAILLERIEPGTPLWQVEDDEGATAIGADVLRSLHREPPDLHRFRALEEAAAHWAETIPADWRATACAYPAALVELAVDACRTLPAADAARVVLHQDFHGGNVLRSRERGWLAIDPKPLVGDPAFDAASLLRDRRWLLSSPDDGRRIRRRLDVLADSTGLDRERMRLWGIVHALAWGVVGGKLEGDMVRCAELLRGA
jgi:streptomycin 6-kinase